MSKTSRQEPADQEGPSVDDAIQTYDQELEDFLVQHADEEKGYHVKVYRVHSIAGERPDYRYLCSYEKVIPSDEVIASRFGPGRYRLYLAYTDRKGKRSGRARIISIDETWGTGGIVPTVPAVAGAPAPGGIGAEHLIAMFSAALNAVALVAKSNKGNGGIEALTEPFTRLLERMGEMQIDGMKRAQELALGVDPDDDDPDDGDEQGFLEMGLSLLMKVYNWLGKGMFSAPKSMIAPALEQPEAKAVIEGLLSRPDEYAKLWEQFCQNTGVEREQLTKFVSRLGLPTPDQLLEAASQAQEQPDQGGDQGAE